MVNPHNCGKDDAGLGARIGFLLAGGTVGGIVAGFGVISFATFMCENSCIDRAAIVKAILVGGGFGAFVDTIIGIVIINLGKHDISGFFMV